MESAREFSSCIVVRPFVEDFSFWMRWNPVEIHSSAGYGLKQTDNTCGSVAHNSHELVITASYMMDLRSFIYLDHLRMT